MVNQNIFKLYTGTVLSHCDRFVQIRPARSCKKFFKIKTDEK